MLLFQIVNWMFNFYLILLVVRILGSWIPELRAHRLMQFVAFYTDPYLNIFRRIIPPLGMIDISPIVAFFALEILRRLTFSFLSLFL